jgi:hypothetical protein
VFRGAVRGGPGACTAAKYRNRRADLGLPEGLAGARRPGARRGRRTGLVRCRGAATPADLDDRARPAGRGDARPCFAAAGPGSVLPCAGVGPCRVPGGQPESWTSPLGTGRAVIGSPGFAGPDGAGRDRAAGCAGRGCAAREIGN